VFTLNSDHEVDSAVRCTAVQNGLATHDFCGCTLRYPVVETGSGTETDTRARLLTLPMPKGRFVPGQPIGPGAGKVQGAVPDDILSATAVDAAGNQVADTVVTNNVYELDIPSFRDFADVRLLHRDGTTTRLPLGPNRR
jgi:hypothetical protein